MSVMLNFAIFPTDKGDRGASEYVSQVLQMISQSGVSYKLNPMGTTIETETMDQALEIVKKSYEILEPQSNRIYCSLTMDIRKGRKNGLDKKIESIESLVGKINH